MSDCPLGAGVQKLTTVKMAYKGRLMIAVPLILLLTFVGLAAHVKRQSESAETWSLHSTEVIGVTRTYGNRLLNNACAIRHTQPVMVAVSWFMSKPIGDDVHTIVAALIARLDQTIGEIVSLRIRESQEDATTEDLCAAGEQAIADAVMVITGTGPCVSVALTVQAVKAAMKSPAPPFFITPGDTHFERKRDN